MTRGTQRNGGRPIRALVGVVAVAATAVSMFVFWQGDESAQVADAADAAEPDTTPFGNLRWEYEGEAPTPIASPGWNETGLRALVELESGLHVVLREPAADDQEQVVYTLRPITEDGIGEPVAEHGGELGRVLPGVPMPWVLGGEERPRGWKFGSEEGGGAPAWQPIAGDALLARNWWVAAGVLVGGALTERRLWATDERPHREHFEDPNGGSGVRIVGPDPIGLERLWTPINLPAASVRIANEPYSSRSEIETSLVVGSAAGSAALLFERSRMALPLDGPLAAPRSYTLEVIRFDARGAELWRRRTQLDGHALDPVASISADETLEAVWRVAGGGVRVVTLSENDPMPLRAMALDGEPFTHELRLIRCAEESWLFDMHAPRASRRLMRRRIADATLGEPEEIFSATMHFDGSPPTGGSDLGHLEWVAAYNGAHYVMALACHEGAVAVVLDLPAQPTTDHRGLVYLQMPVAGG